MTLFRVGCLAASLLGACASGDGSVGREMAPRPPIALDGLVFEGTAASVPGSFGRLVLESRFRETRKLRWESSDSRIGAAEVDFFEPSEWQLQGEPANTLVFSDRSPGPILFGRVQLLPDQGAIVNVVLGGSRVTYTLDRVESGGANPE